jgi:hypothetical protein
MEFMEDLDLIPNASQDGYNGGSGVVIIKYVA